jgi:ABC-2 type transport system ATP-binding protein
VAYTGTPPELSTVPGVAAAEPAGPGRLRFALTGPPGPVLRVLAAAEVTALTVREPSLEEIFLDYYGDRAGR